MIALDDVLGEKHHLDRLAGTLRMPYDSALVLCRTRKGALDAVILTVAGDLLLAPVEYREVTYEAQEAARREHLIRLRIEFLLEFRRF